MRQDTDVLNARDAADFLGVHVETLRRLARRNEIPCFKIGKDWRFRKEALVRWADEQRSGEQRSGEESVRDRRNGGPGYVLVVDDEEPVRRAMVRSLERFGYRARAEERAAAALESIAKDKPDLVLLDLMMPEMNGLMFLEELRKTEPELPVVIVTGYPDSDLMAQAMSHAPLMLLPKPVEPDLLQRTLGAVLGKERSR